MGQFRQGDVLLIKVNDIPKNAQKVTEKIIAHGESSNHCHRVTNNVEAVSYTHLDVYKRQIKLLIFHKKKFQFNLMNGWLL